MEGSLSLHDGRKIGLFARLFVSLSRTLSLQERSLFQSARSHQLNGTDGRTGDISNGRVTYYKVTMRIALLTRAARDAAVFTCFSTEYSRDYKLD